MPVSVARSFHVPLLALALAACGGEAVDRDPTAEVGTGASEFEALAEGDTVAVVQGPQGGYHVFGSVRAAGIVPGDPDDLGDADNPFTEFRVWLDGGRIDASGASYRQGLRPLGDGSYEMIGRLVILGIANDDEIDGLEVELEVEITDTDGVIVGDRRAVIAVPHPNNL